MRARVHVLAVTTTEPAMRPLNTAAPRLPRLMLASPTREHRWVLAAVGFAVVMIAVAAGA